MKDRRFIELLNLYIDRQISAAETDELEAELQAHPRRQAVYRQYCQIHRATTLVGESFRADAPSRASSDRASVLRLESQKASRARWAYYAGGLVAACVAVAFIRFNPPTPGAEQPSAVIASQPVEPAAIVAAMPVENVPVVQPVQAHPGLVSLRNVQTVAPQDYAAMLAALRKEEREAFASGQIQTARLPSLFDDGVFDSTAVWPETRNPAREFRSRNTSPVQQAEFTAFQFQR